VTARPKSTDDSWKRRIGVPWKPAFAGDSPTDGYSRTPDPETWLEKDAAKILGPRDPGPFLLLVFDSRSAGHEKAVAELGRDGRFLVASHLFTCFRVDGCGWPRPPKDVSLAVHGDDGTLFGRVKGNQLHQALDEMERAYEAWTGHRLNRVLPPMEADLAGLGNCEAELEALQKRLVCPDCGETHQNVEKGLAEWRRRRDEYRDTIDRFRRPVRR
jgi:hypothetical protein